MGGGGLPALQGRQPRRPLRRGTVTGRTLVVETLTAEAFAPFGTVVERPRAGGRSANEGTALRFDDIAPRERG
ncbi:MAG: ureidoglycolate lyase [Janthinobacterium lividum]